jgi:hypothetical protein
MKNCKEFITITAVAWPFRKIKGPALPAGPFTPEEVLAMVNFST